MISFIQSAKSLLLLLDMPLWGRRGLIDPFKAGSTFLKEVILGLLKSI
jgi:hypothetical protein